MKKAVGSFIILAAVFVFVLAVSPTTAYAMDIEAQAAIVIDFETGDILFERDIHTPRVPASMTKAMTAFVVFEEIEAGNLTLDTLVRISSNAARISSDTNMQGAPFPLAAGSYHTVDMLIHLAMLPSSNGACVALAEHISGTEAAFVVRMNESAAAIGMFSEFTNAHGAIAHYTNAYSIGLLVREFILRYPDILRITGAPYVVFQGTARNNTNQFLNVRPFAGADGFRTGTTREAGWCLASTAYRNGRRIIVVVMNAPNNERRYGDSETLLNFGFAELARRDREAERAAAALRRASISIVHEGEEIAFSATARITNNHAIAPAQELFEALGVYSYTATAEGRITVQTEDGVTITLRTGSYRIHVGGRVYYMPMQPRVIDGVLFVPVRAVADALGLQVEWDRATRSVIISEN